MTLRCPGGETCTLSIPDEVEEGWVQTENVVLDWFGYVYPQGVLAAELAQHSGLTEEQASERLINLFENDFLSVDGPLRSGRFFLLPPL